MSSWDSRFPVTVPLRYPGPNRDIRLDKSGLKFLSVGNDPGFEFYLQPRQVNYSWLKQLAELVFLIVATWMLGISSVSLKDQGLDFKTIIKKSPWFEKTFESSFGVYGYTSIVGSKTYYRIIKKLVVTLLLFFLLSIVLRGSNTDRLLVLAMIVLSATLVYACLYTSWTVDFQPQGRYMLAIIPVLSILYGNNYRLINRTVMAAGIVAVYALSQYSFICYGLAQIPFN